VSVAGQNGGQLTIGNLKEDHSTSWLPYMEQTINYNNWVYSNYKKYLGQRILDIGSGFGTFVEYYKDKEIVLCVEPSTDACGFLLDRFAGMDNIVLLSTDVNDDVVIERAKELSIDTIVCLNVLEHIKDDKLVISNMNNVLKTGGKLILYVPAMKMIYGTLDVALYHHRRYDKSELEKMLKEAGFEILSSRYMNFLGVLSWFIYSRVLKRSIPAEGRILFYDKYLVPIVSFIEKIIRPPFGQSLLIIAGNLHTGVNHPPNVTYKR
jgi:2-polyprenyl-3-methyl-5-hydroxy-6-metoxy-1,4-benzoquinol methylase